MSSEEICLLSFALITGGVVLKKPFMDIGSIYVIIGLP